MKIKKGFELRTVCGEDVIIAHGLENIDFSKMINLNETASFLWKHASSKSNFTINDLTDGLLTEYQVDTAVAVEDVKRIVKEWKDLGLLEKE